MSTKYKNTKIKSINVQGAPSLRSLSMWQKALIRLRQDKTTLTAMFVLLIFALLALFAPIINNNILQVDPDFQDVRNKYAPMFSEGHILGTDELGRDQLTRLLNGAQVSLGIAFSAALLSLGIGVAVGVFAGYYGGIIDDAIIWFITTLNSIPSLFLLIIISAVLSPGPVALVLVFGLLGWTGTTRLVRGETYSLKEREFAIAAKASGASDLRIMFVHIVPNILSLLIIGLSQAMGGLILAESALSFLGIGIKAPIPTWGNMLDGGLEYMRRGPHLVFFPGLLITITVLCLYIIGDGLRDAFDPKIAD